MSGELEDLWLDNVLKNVREHWHDGQRFSGESSACPICQAQRISTLEAQRDEAVELLEHVYAYAEFQPGNASRQWHLRRDTLLAKIKEGK